MMNTGSVYEIITLSNLKMNLYAFININLLLNWEVEAAESEV